ncbi:MAG: DUF177 domain-containing protein [Nitrospirota bacterium]
MPLPSPHLTEIPDEGLSLVCEVRPDELALGPDDGRSRGELSLSVELATTGKGASATGVLSGIFLRECVRCLKEYEDPVRIPFAAEYRRQEGAMRGLPKSSAKSCDGETQELEELGDEVYPFDGDRLELAGMLREQVILATPMQPLCREDCPGLCPVCGQDLNERQCGCPGERRDSPFAILHRKIEARGKGLKGR